MGLFSRRLNAPPATTIRQLARGQAQLSQQMASLTNTITKQGVTYMAAIDDLKAAVADLATSQAGITTALTGLTTEVVTANTTIADLAGQIKTNASSPALISQLAAQIENAAQANTTTAQNIAAQTNSLAQTIASTQTAVGVPVTVTPTPALTTLTLSPATASVAPGATEQFTAAGADQNGNPMTPDPAPAWSTTGGGTVDASGLFTADETAGGPFTVTAASASISGTAEVIVAASAAS